ncbi:WbuC family cupin fold metalloprotein [Propionivibrio sp.]|uniref:WbuC family cupin fold metalloprotein n=1 Tax=Propionivibrio sp. TaxID=2212460 RepID=UPI002638E879|nr:WbuC family cupin fold metalloprotein [Propionivibrio sp.]
MKQISASQLDALARTAQAAPRRRANLNLHEMLTDPVQRLAIAMEPETLIRPHRHQQTWELLLPVRGRFVVLHFDKAGVVTGRAVLGEDTAALETPAGQWHAVLSLDTGGVIFEIKHGPYTPIETVDFAPWVTSDEEPQALLSWYGTARLGSSFADLK